MDLYVTDPEFIERFEHFAFEEVPNEEGQQLDDITRYTAILAALIGCQAVDYLGIGRVLPFLNVTNEIFEKRGILLPLKGQCTTTMENRLEKGVQAQGGCEPQLTAHAKGNMNLGNDKDFLIRVVSQCLPYIGYPRSLNAIACINKAAE